MKFYAVAEVMKAVHISSPDLKAVLPLLLHPQALLEYELKQSTVLGCTNEFLNLQGTGSMRSLPLLQFLQTS